MSKDQTSDGITVEKGSAALKAKAVSPKNEVVPPKTEVVPPKTNVPAVEGAVTEKKAKVLIKDITRGRMPIAVVYLVRFGDQKGGETKDLATMFGTTVGKIMDIKKRSTFAYLTESFAPSEAQKAEGIAWLQRHVAFKDGKVDGLIGELETMKVATPEQQAAQDATRVAARAPSATKKDGTVADGGGGNRQKAAKAPAEKVPVMKASGADLLK